MNKTKYNQFCAENYVPIYSKPWWLDVVSENGLWDVWMCEQDGKIQAAMPHHLEFRGKYRYVTKAPLTQNNGIIFGFCTKTV